jgi:hypothetical protein
VNKKKASSQRAQAAQAFNQHRSLLVGGNGIALKDFLLQPVTHWTGGR